MSAVTAPAIGGERSPPLSGALAALHRCLEELAFVSDQIVGATELRDSAELIDKLFERSAVLRADLARASTDAKACTLPPGSEGTALIGAIKSLNQRIRAGSAAAEKLIASRQTVAAFGERIVLQTMANLASTARWPSVVRLREAFRGVPAVIVSAGPSLDRNIEVLKRFEGRALVVAVSHALRALLRAGVRVDLCIAVDAQDLRYHFESGLADKVGALVLGTSVHPDLFALPARRFFTVAGNAVLDGWAHRGFEEEFTCRSGGSVANHAFSLATLWGCDPIILVGQDLSFPGGRLYAASTCDGEARVKVASDGRSATVTEASQAYVRLGGGGQVLLRQLPGYYEGTVLTSFAFEKAWEWFVETARGLAGTRTLVNCTEGGARIEGMEHVPLDVAATRYATRGVDVERVLDAAIGEIQRADRERQMLERVGTMMKALDRCAARAAECAALSERAASRPDAMRALAEKEKELTLAVDAVDFVSTMVQRELHSAMKAGARAKTVEEGLAQSARIYRAVLQIVAATRAPLEKVRAALLASQQAPT